MPDEASPTSTNRKPHRNFPLPFRRARQQQAGQIHACEQNHERTHGGEHAGEGKDRIRNVGNEQAGFPEPNAAADVLRIILCQLCSQCLKRSPRLSERHIRLQPADGEKVSRVTFLQIVVPGLDRLRHHYGDEHLGIVGDFGANESFRRDADNSERAAIELHRLADDRGIAAKSVLPAIVTDHSYGM